MRYDLAVIVPTLNEAPNIGPLYERLKATLVGIRWELIFVDDDSTDGTAALVWRLAETAPNVRCIHRIGRRGLASACIEGMLASGAPYLAVMDADLQHDETLLPRMLAAVRDERLDIVVASRFLGGSSMEQFSSTRERLSRIGNKLAGMIMRSELTDPLSGFFMLRRELLMEVADRLTGQGFKILVDIFASAGRPLAFRELPFTFRPRHAGTSKLDTLVSIEFLMLLADKLLGRYLPIRFVLFVIVGLSGVVVHLAALGLLFRGVGLDFLAAQALATLIAMTSNFYFNNMFTYRDRRLRGREFARGLLTFYLACSIGAVINVEIAQLLFQSGALWPVAGVLGAVVGSVWNYSITTTFTWSKKKRAARLEASEATPQSQVARTEA